MSNISVQIDGMKVNIDLHKCATWKAVAMEGRISQQALQARLRRCRRTAHKVRQQMVDGKTFPMSGWTWGGLLDDVEARILGTEQRLVYLGKVIRYADEHGNAPLVPRGKEERSIATSTHK